MSRSLKKGPYVEAKLFQRVEAMNQKGDKKVIRTWSRASTIFPQMPTHYQLMQISGLLCRLRKQYPDNRLDSFILQQGMPKIEETRFEPVSADALQDMARACPAELGVQVRAAPRIIWKNYKGEQR